MLTTAGTRDYFAHGSIQHLSHVIQDLEQFYERPKETYERALAAMFSSNPLPSLGNADQFTDGGGPAFMRNRFEGTERAAQEAEARAQLRRPAPHRPHERPAALQPGSRHDADPHPRRRPRLRLARRSRRLRAAEAALQHLRPDGRLLRHDAPQPGLARPRPAVQRALRRTSAWSASSRPRGGRTSSCRPAATEPSRCSSSPEGAATRAGRLHDLPGGSPGLDPGRTRARPLRDRIRALLEVGHCVDV